MKTLSQKADFFTALLFLILIYYFGEKENKTWREYLLLIFVVGAFFFDVLSFFGLLE